MEEIFLVIFLQLVTWLTDGIIARIIGSKFRISSSGSFFFHRGFNEIEVLFILTKLFRYRVEGKNRVLTWLKKLWF